MRLVTCGSVDDGKSTLIGRLLYDTKQVLVDQLEHVEATSERRGDGYVTWLADGRPPGRARAGDHDRRRLPVVSHRAAPFQIADAPGHVQYTRNMVTGASTADVAIVLLDARKGVIEQTRRARPPSRRCSRPARVSAVNKMDLVDYDAGRFA